MVTESITAPVLEYASATGPIAPDAADPVLFHVGMPPVSPSTYLAMNGPHALWPMLLSTALVASADFELSPRVGWALTVVGVTAVALLASFRRHVLAERAIGATAEYIYFSDGRTSGRGATLVRRDRVGILVRRSVWRPWLHDLVAVPVNQPRAAEPDDPVEPVVLLSSFDRPSLERIAAGLRQAGGDLTIRTTSTSPRSAA